VGDVLALSVYIAAHNPRAAPTGIDALAALEFSVCLIGESVADAQIAAFSRRNPPEKTV
jgi:steroid 5-alpha reductase family enzyme